MRISTNTIFQSGSSSLSELQSALLKTQQQISANRRVLTPSDDPIAAARALEVTQYRSMNTQYATNRQAATNALNLEESVLQSVTELLQDAQTQVIEAGNAAYDDTQRKYIATDLRGRLQDLLGLANTRDSSGNYIFSGYQTTTEPFPSSASGLQYDGDQGQRMLQVGAARKLAISTSGDAIFSKIRSSDTFVAAVSATNTGTGAVAPLAIADATLLTGHDYNVVFDVTAGVTTYSIQDVTLGTTLSTGNAYTSPQLVTMDGLQFNVSGAPDDGDVMTVRPSGTQSVFQTINDLIALLETPSTGATGKANLTHGLAVANSNLANALDNVLTIRASVGSSLNELETLDSAGEDRDLQYADMLSQLQDLDYVKAISDLTLQKTVLEAAQQSFIKLSGLSLFNYI